jgi:hypothetical protein
LPATDETFRLYGEGDENSPSYPIIEDTSVYINIPGDCTTSDEISEWTNPSTTPETCTHKWEMSYDTSTVA